MLAAHEAERRRLDQLNSQIPRLERLLVLPAPREAGAEVPSRRVPVPRCHITNRTISRNSDAHLQWMARDCTCNASIVLGSQNKPAPRFGRNSVRHLTLPKPLEYLDLSFCHTEAPILEGPMPILRQLKVITPDFQGTLDFRDAPLLDSASCDVITVNVVAFPWTQLTSLHLFEIAFYHAYHEIKKAFNLVYCNLDLHTMDDPDEVSDLGPRIELPHLKALSMQPDSRTKIDYLDLFTLPTLSHLDIDEGLLGPDPIAALTTFVSRCGCPLQYVRITSNEMLVSGNVYRTTFPSIQQFVFEDADWSY
ncbi:hypothetical protein R3P38DRAFT_2909411 [Favolaschia claudopus]|uniref:Uncharacterized protein n=1 Tax=Favolaschia claudopus TaxID=2862362 RepID=A0AAW0C823_9AGAR